MKCASTAIVFICALAVGVASAAPSPEITYLMNEPASMFDMGLMRLGEFFTLSLRNTLARMPMLSNPQVITTYVSSDNRINVILNVDVAPTPGAVMPTAAARDTVRKLHTYYYEDQFAFRLDSSVAAEYFGEMFKHIGFGKAKEQSLDFAQVGRSIRFMVFANYKSQSDQGFPSTITAEWRCDGSNLLISE